MGSGGINSGMGRWEVYCWVPLDGSWALLVSWALGRWGPWAVGCGTAEWGRARGSWVERISRAASGSCVVAALGACTGLQPKHCRFQAFGAGVISGPAVSSVL